jgi:hypothetical protein
MKRTVYGVPPERSDRLLIAGIFAAIMVVLGVLALLVKLYAP